MKPHHLRDLLAVVEKGSMHAAAKHPNMSQPALSRSIRDLEKEIGIPLLERRSRGAILTPMGAMFAERARAAVSELRRAKEEIEQLQGAVSGTVVVCFSSVTHVKLWPEAIIPFRKRFPRIQLQVIEATYPMIEPRLRDGSVDFFVGPCMERGPAPGLEAEVLVRPDGLLVFARKGHPLASATTLAELMDADWVSSSVTTLPEAEFREKFTRHNLPPPKLAIRAESFLTWLTALVHSDMLALLSPYYADAPITRDLIQPIPLKETFASPDGLLVRRAAIPLTPAAEYLADLIRRAAKDSRAPGAPAGRGLPGAWQAP